MIRIYTASKLRHGPMWRNLCDHSRRFIFHARWLKHNKMGTPDTREEAVEFWRQDIQDVLTADAVIVYSENDEVLRGALVEVGVALSSGIPVFVIGHSTSYGTWQYHKGVTWVQSLDRFFSDYLDTISPR